MSYKDLPNWIQHPQNFTPLGGWENFLSRVDFTNITDKRDLSYYLLAIKYGLKKCGIIDDAA